MTKEPSSRPKLKLVFIEVGDGERLREFYAKTLGLELQKEFGLTWVEYGETIGPHIAVHEIENQPDDTQPRLFLSFEANDVVELRSSLIASGAPCSEIRQRDRGAYFTSEDPAGTRIHFIQFNDEWREKTSY